MRVARNTVQQLGPGKGSQVLGLSTCTLAHTAYQSDSVQRPSVGCASALAWTACHQTAEHSAGTAGQTRSDAKQINVAWTVPVTAR